MGEISRKDSVEKGVEIMVRWKSTGKKNSWEEIPKGTERKETCSSGTSFFIFLKESRFRAFILDILKFLQIFFKKPTFSIVPTQF